MSSGARRYEPCASDHSAVRKFTGTFTVCVGVGVACLLLPVLQSLANGLEDWPMVVGVLLFGGSCISLRIRLHRVPDQQRAWTIWSWSFACLHCVFIDGPVYASPHFAELPPLSTAHWMFIALFCCALYSFFTCAVCVSFVPRMLMRASMMCSIAVAPNSFTELGQPHQTLYMGAGLLVGEMLALLVERRENAQEFAHVHELREVERKAFRVINHTSKRVMSNTAQSCELLARKLEKHTEALGADAAAIFDLIHGTRAESVNGFQSCRSMILQAAVIRGDHTPGRDEFTMSALLEELGLSRSARVDCSGATRFGGLLRADKQLLIGILFNATQNALQHGEAEGRVVVDALVSGDDSTEGDVLRITVSNRPGDSHEQLLALLSATKSNDLLLESSSIASLRSGGLQRLGLGNAQSTFLGLDEMRAFARAFRPPADIHLWVRPDGAMFELRVRVVVVSPSPSSPGSAAPADALAPRTLPEGLAFVCCDDDMFPRMLAPLLITAACASEEESLVLGETYDEVAELVELVVAKGRRLGNARVVCVIDQNLEAYAEGAFYGTELIKEMRARDFDGLVIVQSANDGPEDERAYLAAGADGCLGKAIKGGAPAMLTVICRLWHQRFGEASAATQQQRLTG